MVLAKSAGSSYSGSGLSTCSESVEIWGISYVFCLDSFSEMLMLSVSVEKDFDCSIGVLSCWKGMILEIIYQF